MHAKRLGADSKVVDVIFKILCVLSMQTVLDSGVEIVKITRNNLALQINNWISKISQLHALVSDFDHFNADAEQYSPVYT